MITSKTELYAALKKDPRDPEANEVLCHIVRLVSGLDGPGADRVRKVISTCDYVAGKGEAIGQA